MRFAQIVRLKPLIYASGVARTYAPYVTEKIAVSVLNAQSGGNRMQIGYKDAITLERWIGDEIHPDNDILCITKREGSYWIYNVILGKPFLRIRFKDRTTAVSFGNLLHRWYGEFLPILRIKDWMNADIPCLFQHTIPHGVEIYQALQEFKDKEIENDLNRFIHYI